MENTQYYQLSLWNQDDRILMDTFNGNNAKLDAALQAAAEAREGLAETVAQRGNCQVQFQTYTGTGSGNNSFTFPHKPLLVVVFGDNTYFFALQGYYRATCWTSGGRMDTATVTWDGKAVSWSADSTGSQCNTSGKAYNMLVVMDVND